MSFSMPDDFTLTMPLLIAAVLGVFSLFLSWYLRSLSDPVVRSLYPPVLVTVSKRFYTSPAQRYPDNRVL